MRPSLRCRPGPGMGPAAGHHGYGAPPVRAPVLRNRSVQLLLISSFASSTAVLALTVALGKQVYDITGSELDLGLLGLAEFLPSALLVLVSGPVADRFDRRRIGAIALAGEAVAAGGVFASTRDRRRRRCGRSSPSSCLFGVARAFVTPALRALPPSVVPGRNCPELVAYSSISWQSAIIGPAASAGSSTPPTRMALPRSPPPCSSRPSSASAPCTSELDLPPPGSGPADPRAPRWRACGSSAASPILFAAISLDLFAVLFGGAVALLPAIAEDRFGVSAHRLGWLRARRRHRRRADGDRARRAAGAPPRRTDAAVSPVGVFGLTTVVLGVTTQLRRRLCRARSCSAAPTW